ncbi:MAG: oligosaccharide flippase family protein [Methanobacteriota archaeon]
MEGMARKAAFNMLAKSVVTVVTLLSFLYMGKNADPGAVAMLAFALGFVGIFTFVSDLGFGAAHVKRLSEGGDEAKCNATFLYAKLALTGAMVACVLAAVFVWDTVNPEGAFNNPEQRWAVYIILIYYALFSLAQVPVVTFSGRMESAKQQMPETLGTLARAPLIVYAVMAGLGAVALSLSYVGTGLVMLIVAALLFRSYKVGHPDRETFKSYSGYATPIILILLILVLSQNLPPVLIAYFTGSDVEVAGYFMVQRVTLIFILVSSSVSPILFPKLSKDHACKDIGAMNDTCKASERIISMYMVPVVAATAALAPALIHIFLADTYLPMASALVLLVAYAFVTSIDMTYVNVLYGIGRPDINLRLGIVTVSVTLAGFAILIPRTFFGLTLLGGGATGAAAALLLGGCAEYAVSRYYAKKMAGIESYQRIWIHIFAGATMAGILYGLHAAHLVDRWYTLAGASALGLGLYAAILWAANELRRRDLKFIAEILNVRKMLSYISTELRGKK